MKLESKLEYDLGRIVDAISSVEGVLAMIFFGSRARGDYDEHSDYDFLVIFRDDKTMWRNRRELYKRVGGLGLFTQILTRSLREFKEIEPTFLENVLKEGRLLYVRFPFEIPAFFQELAPTAIISYNLKNLSHQDKMRLTYRLFGRKVGTRNYKGIIYELGGMRLGYGSVAIPEEKLKKVTDLLNLFNVKYRVIKVLVPTGQTKIAPYIK